MESLKWLGKGHGFMAVVILLTALSTGLLIGHYLSEANWVSFMTWVWSAQVIGGIGHGVSDALTPKS